MRELTTGQYLAGEVWVSLMSLKAIFLHGKYPERYTKGKKSKSANKMQRKQGWNPLNIIECDSCNHWFHFKCDYFLYIIVFCFHYVLCY